MTHLSSDSVLARISTHWSQIGNPVQFVARYAPAIQKYFQALIRDRQESEDAAQDFLARVSRYGFENVGADRGRFRDYLTVSVKNAAFSHLKRMQRRQDRQQELAEREVVVEQVRLLDDEWLQPWRACILDEAWRGLFFHQRNSRGNLYHTILRLRSENPQVDDATLATTLSVTLEQPLQPAAFRKQLSRARRMFAELIVEEVARTIREPTPDLVEQELIDIGLMSYVKPFLAADWRERGLLSDADADA